MDFETILYTKSEGVARITLNRPERLNAINHELQEDILAALDDIDGDPEARVVLITGAGRAFCAGADIGGGGRRDDEGSEGIRQGLRRGVQRVPLALQRFDKPTIAMINGLAVGGGFDYALACDIRIGCENSRFMVAFTRIGLFPGTGGTWLYPRAMGVAKALEMLFTGDFMEADEALRVGVLNRLVPASELEEFTMDMARRIAKGPPIAQRLAKLQVYKGLNMDFATALEVAAAAETITITSEDAKEGRLAFREKRAAMFRGR